MKKSLLLIMSLLIIMILTACGSTSTEIESSVDKDENKSEEKAKEEVEEQTEEETEEQSSENVSEVIYNDNGIVITYLGIKKETDSIFGDSVEIKFDVENNTERDIVIQSRDLSADGRMVNDSFVTMSDEVVAGKIGTATLDIMALGDEELPSMEEEIELNLKIFDWDDMFDFEITVPVKIDLK